MHIKHDPGTELRRQLIALQSPIDDGTRAALRTAVCDYVDEGKRLGWTPERVIVGLKRIARAAGLRPSAHVVLTVATSGVTETDSLLAEMIAWCIDRYYAER